MPHASKIKLASSPVSFTMLHAEKWERPALEVSNFIHVKGGQRMKLSEGSKLSTKFRELPFTIDIFKPSREYCTIVL